MQQKLQQKLHIDIETYSSIDIKKSGSYKYCESLDFEILMIAYAINDEPVKIIDLTQEVRGVPQEFLERFLDPRVELHAHNANFERKCFDAIGWPTSINRWRCSAVKSAYCGLPLALGQVSAALELEEKGKLATGMALIRYFSCPVKATKKNGGRVRNFPIHDLEKWNEYKLYCINDVEAEREIGKRLSAYTIPEFERQNYILDQEINDRGILLDTDMAKNVLLINAENAEYLYEEMQEITGLENPNSGTQLRKWLGEAMKKDIPSLAKEFIPNLLAEAEGPAKEVLELRALGSKTSIKKYDAMLNCVCEDGRAHGLFQFYGSRTGRWAGRLIQLQNLPQNHLEHLDEARELASTGTFDEMNAAYSKVASTLSQLIRTAFIAKPDHTFAVADFSAIEARVIAWLASEKWRMDVFDGDGKIYEASASMMFNVPIEEITKGSDLRGKGKVAELALGYQGSVGAMVAMGADKMGLSEPEIKQIVAHWREASPNIVKLWHTVERAAIRAIKTGKEVTLKDFRDLVFNYDGKVLTIKLPSGRELFYQSARLYINKFEKQAVQYKGKHQITGKWTWIDSYGGKFVENIVQAIARDLLTHSIAALSEVGYDIVMHVHDEVVAEVVEEDSDVALDVMCQSMGAEVPWAEGLKLVADGYVTPYYKKD